MALLFRNRVPYRTGQDLIALFLGPLFAPHLFGLCRDLAPGIFSLVADTFTQRFNVSPDLFKAFFNFLPLSAKDEED